MCKHPTFTNPFVILQVNPSDNDNRKFFETTGAVNTEIMLRIGLCTDTYESLFSLSLSLSLSLCSHFALLHNAFTVSVVIKNNSGTRWEIVGFGSGEKDENEFFNCWSLP